MYFFLYSGEYFLPTLRKNDPLRIGKMYPLTNISKHLMRISVHIYLNPKEIWKSGFLDSTINIEWLDRDSDCRNILLVDSRTRNGPSGSRRMCTVEILRFGVHHRKELRNRYDFPTVLDTGRGATIESAPLEVTNNRHENPENDRLR
jgi:hypothetical protein